MIDKNYIEDKILIIKKTIKLQNEELDKLFNRPHWELSINQLEKALKIKHEIAEYEYAIEQLEDVLDYQVDDDD